MQTTPKTPVRGKSGVAARHTGNSMDVNNKTANSMDINKTAYSMDINKTATATSINAKNATAMNSKGATSINAKSSTSINAKSATASRSTRSGTETGAINQLRGKSAANTPLVKQNSKVSRICSSPSPSQHQPQHEQLQHEQHEQHELQSPPRSASPSARRTPLASLPSTSNSLSNTGFDTQIDLLSAAVKHVDLSESSAPARISSLEQMLKKEKSLTSALSKKNLSLSRLLAEERERVSRLQVQLQVLERMFEKANS